MSALFTDDSWTLATIEGREGPPYVARFRSALPSPVLRAAWPTLVIVTWPYDASDSTGMPAAPVHAEMNAFEDAIESSVEAPGIAVQAVSITGRGNREWRFYIQDATAFVEAMNAGLEGHPPYPLDLAVFADPDWNGLAEFLSGEK